MAEIAPLPPFVDPCGCGGRATRTSDGISDRYECTCGQLLADLIIGAEP